MRAKMYFLYNIYVHTYIHIHTAILWDVMNFSKVMIRANNLDSAIINVHIYIYHLL